jgi:CheY-like chemotaxis protein
MSEVGQEDGPLERSGNMGHQSAGPPHLERRHSFRVHLPGRASLWRQNQLLGQYRLRDLSIAGCALVGRSSGKPGDHVELVLHLHDDRPLWISATIRRSHGNHIALRFERPTARVEDRLQDVIVETYARTHLDHARFSLVIEPNAALRRMLVRSLDGLGHRAVGVATPLDAVQLLLERGEHVHAAFLGPPPRVSGATFELVEFLARYHPNVRRVLVGDAQAIAHAAAAEQAGELHARLELPCSDHALRVVVHRLESIRSDDDDALDA